MKKTIQLITSVFCFALGVSSLYAATGTWTGGNGDWDSATSPGWLDGNVPNGAGEVANITANSTGGRSVTLNVDRTVGTVRLAAGGAAPPRNSGVFGSGTLTLDNGGSKPDIIALSGNTATNSIGCTIAGVNGLRAPVSGGRVVLSGANTYTGDTQIQRRMVRIRNVDALPYGSRSGNVEFIVATGGSGDSASLEIDGLDAVTINGLSSNTNAYEPVNQRYPTICAYNAPSGTCTLSIGDNDQGGTFHGKIRNGGTASISGDAVSTLAITKIGSGTITLDSLSDTDGGSDYSGETSVNAGTLIMNGIFTGTGAVKVNSGVLGGDCTLAGKVFVYAGGSIAPGASPGIMHLQGGLDLSAGGAYLWQLAALKDNSDGTAGVDFDQIDYQWLGGEFDLADSTLTVDLSGVNTSDPFWNSSHTWTIITSAFNDTGSSEPTSINVVGGTPPGDFAVDNTGTKVDLTFTFTGVVPFNPPVPKITSVVPTSPTSVTINYTNTVAGTNYVVQYRTNLNTTNWTHLAPVAAGGTTSSSTDTPPADSAQRFYRVYGKF